MIYPRFHDSDKESILVDNPIMTQAAAVLCRMASCLEIFILTCSSIEDGSEIIAR